MLSAGDEHYILSSTGFGIDQLRDDCMETYWQSDGQLPHLVNIQFQRKTMVSHIYIYTDYKLDESYTPSRISIRAGTHFNDLQEIEVIELIEPSGMIKTLLDFLLQPHLGKEFKGNIHNYYFVLGWEVIPIKDIHDRPIRTYMIQIAVLSNHQNGRDTHMRQIKVHSPCETTSFDINKFRNFSTVQFQQYATIR